MAMPTTTTNYPISSQLGSAHHDSGVPSLAFALASKGGAHPDPNESTIEVTALVGGIVDAAEILYEALVGYYDPLETMQEAAEDQTLAALNDFGYQAGCSFASAWYAVGVDEAFWYNGNSGWAVSYMGNVSYSSGGRRFGCQVALGTVLQITVPPQARWTFIRTVP